MAPKPVEKVLQETKIEQIAKSRVLQAPPELSVAKAIALMQEKQDGYVVITKNKKVIGIFTEVDVARKILEKEVDWNRSVSDFMTPSPTVLTPADSISKAIAIMGEHRYYHIPLVNEKQELVEVLSVRSVIRFLAEMYPTEVFNLPPKPNQMMETVEGG